jgi:3-hydroxy acid dehydrogenase/malonic semialdehyde reductase
MIVLVTGATAGFGAVIARRFVAEGHRVIAAGRRTERLADLRAELGDSVLPVTMDVRDRAAVAGRIAALPAGWAEIDVLVNNAGLALGLEPAQRADLDAWDIMVDTNAKGLMYVTRAVLPGMVARNRADLHGTRVRVTDIEPGLVAGTEFSSVRFGGDAARAATMYDGTDPLLPEDIAEAVFWVTSQPARVNVNTLELMPVCQSFARLAVHKAE